MTYPKQILITLSKMADFASNIVFWGIGTIWVIIWFNGYTMKSEFIWLFFVGMAGVIFIPGEDYMKEKLTNN